MPIGDIELHTHVHDVRKQWCYVMLTAGSAKDVVE
jgi:hypothetical protein